MERLRKMNLGCGPDIKGGWLNVDTKMEPQIDAVWDARSTPYWENEFDFVLVNHVLCTMKPFEVNMVISNIYSVLKPGGKVQIIDMDLLKAIESYRNGRPGDFPVIGQTLDNLLVNHISGFGTRLSLYTPATMSQLLHSFGFNEVHHVSSSQYDTRPLESLIVEGTK